MGPCTASSCCCQARNLPWAPRTNSSCCCQARNLSWAPVPRLLMLLPGPESLMGPCTASHCCCLHRHTLPCATFRSPHTAGGFHFFHRVLYGLPLLLPPPPHCGSTLWFCPVTAQMSEVCGDSKIDGTHLHVILTVSIISLPQQTPRAFKLKVQCSALI
ncbi:unnamed protein product [Staurois parvus]|uniref:Uncharacterized protein n=1 Tax=Staurois parvus TaxID=386267 RepID=A0ABN9EGV6_9NEOB|nr:unnamed protein product [Staurois parvus]